MQNHESDLCEIARMNLQYRSKHDAPMAGKFGSYLGRGDGSIDGPQVTGTVTWDLYENQGKSACEANLVGTIHTLDAADIHFDVLGFFKRNNDRQTWSLSSAVRFSTDDDRFACFDDCIGMISGEFDMESYSHQYRVFAPACDG